QIFPAMYSDVTVIDPTAVKRFLAATSLLASLRGAGSDESYDVYVYPALQPRDRVPGGAARTLLPEN
ncbi:MAG: hypothetical protein ABIW33_02355, partial [Sphingomicrobium sp.]